MGIWGLLLILLWSCPNNAECAVPRQRKSIACPLNFTMLRNFAYNWHTVQDRDDLKCTVARVGLQIVLSEYLRTDGLFFPPENASEACWDAYQERINRVDPKFAVRTRCGFETRSMGTGCMNITTRRQFEEKVPLRTRRGMARACNLVGGADCAQCTTNRTSVLPFQLNGSEEGKVAGCNVYPAIYVAATATPFGPTEQQTVWCLFMYQLNPGPRGSKAVSWCFKVGAAVASFVVIATLMGFLFWKRRERANAKQKVAAAVRRRQEPESAVLNPNSMLKRFSVEEIRAATGNFSRDKLLGAGMFGNVYRGVLQDGSVVACKRFKNCSPAGDAEFVHELEIIASVRHRNLVALIGFCMTSAPLEGHQRIIVCEYMSNGSLHDHLFGSRQRRLDWPTRERIAIGMATGLAYLHHEAEPAIIHRDIKANNILLDDEFEARLGDFGLAKFNPGGQSHMTTRVAGTLGYLAPEYAIYGRVTEKSDIFSFGVVLLQLLSGRKAIISGGESETSHISDWAWALLKSGRGLEVIEEGMENQGPPEVMGKYVMVALLCCHPQVFCRLSANQALRIMLADAPVPPIPDRPVPFVAHMEDIHRQLDVVTGDSFHAPRETNLSAQGGV